MRLWVWFALTLVLAAGTAVAQQKPAEPSEAEQLPPPPPEAKEKKPAAKKPPPRPAPLDADEIRVVDVTVEGVRRVDPEAVLAVVKTRAGQPLNPPRSPRTCALCGAKGSSATCVPRPSRLPAACAWCSWSSSVQRFAR